MKCPGDACDDGDEDTVFDVIGEDCMCMGVPACFGCTDDDACNYDDAANVDDESCYTLGSGSITGPLFPFAGDDGDVHLQRCPGDSFEWSVTGGEMSKVKVRMSLTVVWGEKLDGAVIRGGVRRTGCEGEVVRTVQILEDHVRGDWTSCTLSSFPTPPAIGFSWIGAPTEISRQTSWCLYDVRGAEVLSRVDVVVLRRIGPRSLHLEGHNGPGQVTLPLMVH